MTKTMTWEDDDDDMGSGDDDMVCYEDESDSHGNFTSIMTK